MKKIIAMVLSGFTAFVVTAQAPKEKTLLWKITSKDATAPSYLYGTFHLLCPDDFNMPEAVQQVFHQTKQLYLEIDLDDPMMMAKMMKGIKMKDGHTLKEYMSAKDYDSCAKIFKEKTSLPLSMVASYKPFMLSSMLYPAMIGCQPIAFEKEFEKMAKADSMEINGLETIEDQLAVFDKVPYSSQAKMLVKSLFDFDKGKQQFFEMVAKYKTKNVAALHDDISGDTELGNYEKMLLDKRNKNWIPVIAKAVAIKPTFIAVGAGHLGGKKGVINLLRKQGYKVTPVMY
ncbi:MAG: TraB/GumN family protein [Chitinophagaceae bacterium]|nr:TraB/GumN family protein [Chitinophagaceae bacterium]